MSGTTEYDTTTVVDGRTLGPDFVILTELNDSVTVWAPQWAQISALGGIDRLNIDFGAVQTINGQNARFTEINALLNGSFPTINMALYALNNAGDQYVTTNYSNRYLGFENYHIGGTTGDDRITTDDGDDRIEGGDGDDVIDSRGGMDTVFAGAGNDKVLGHEAGDSASGGEGFDVIDFDFGDVDEDIRIRFNDLSDTTAGGFTSDNVGWGGFEAGTGRLGSGDDWITVVAPEYDLNGGGGIDKLEIDYRSPAFDDPGPSRRYTSVDYNAQSSSVRLWYDLLGPDYEVIDTSFSLFAVSSFEEFILGGTHGDDIIRTNQWGDDIIYGWDGDDRIYTGTGFDQVDAGNGDDRIYDVTDGDIVAGGNGFDQLFFDVSYMTEDTIIDLPNNIGAGDGVWRGVEIVSGTLGSGNDTVSMGSMSGGINAGNGYDRLLVDLSGPLPDRQGVLGDVATAVRFTANDSVSSNAFYTVRDAEGDSYTVSNHFTRFEVYEFTATDGDDFIETESGADIIHARGGNDDIRSGAGADQIFAGDGDDRIDVGEDSAADTVDAGDGNDEIRNVAAGDIVHGGAGFDTLENVDLSGVSDDIAIDLITGTGTGGVSWTGIEAVQGELGSGDDVFKAGNQRLGIDGGAGLDRLIVDYSGQHDFDGQTGVYTQLYLDYRDARHILDYELLDGTADQFGSAFSDFEEFHVTTSEGDDYVETEDWGNDRIFTLGGNDSIRTGLGGDYIDAGAGDDTIREVYWNKEIHGGEGFDTVYADLSGTSESIVVDLTQGTATGGTTWTGVERMFGELGDGDDTFIDGGRLSGLNGGAGVDVLHLDYSAGLDGTSDTLLYIDVRLSDRTTARLERADGSAYSDSDGNFINFEILNVTTTDGADTVRAGNRGDTVRVGDGNDLVYTYGGDDVISIGAGNNRVFAGDGYDSVHIDANFADLAFDLIPSSFRVDVTWTALDDTVLGVSRLEDVEEIVTRDGVYVMAQIYPDLFDSGYDEVAAYTGEELRLPVLDAVFDQLLTTGPTASLEDPTGAPLPDWITWDADAREIVLNTPDDASTGPAEIDFVIRDGSGNTWRDTIAVTYGENPFAAGPETDVLIGDAEDNELRGLGGDDRLTGNGGDDILDGGDGWDTADYSVDTGTSGITADLAAGRVADGFGNTDSLVGIEALIGTGGVDVVTGSDGADHVRTMEGDDLLHGSIGRDFFDGGDGADSMDYSAMQTGMRVLLHRDLATGNQTRDVLTSIETVIGSDFRDILVGTTSTEHLSGGAGDDVLRMVADASTQLDGGEGDDQIIGFDGDEVIDAGIGDDLVRSGRGADQVQLGDGNDVGRFGDGADMGQGGAGVDRLFGNGSNDILYGGADNDRLDGGRGADQLFGDDGDDALRGGTGVDRLTGGAGDDALYGGKDPTGDGNRDTFVFAATNNGADRIKDFEDGRDFIDLTDFGFTSFLEIEQIAANIGSFNLRLDFGDGNNVVIENFRLLDFGEEDVIWQAA